MHNFNEDFEGIIDPAWYELLDQEHPIGEDGHPTHTHAQYVLTREDVGHFIGVRYEEWLAVDEQPHSSLEETATLSTTYAAAAVVAAPNSSSTTETAASALSNSSTNPSGRNKNNHINVQHHHHQQHGQPPTPPEPDMHVVYRYLTLTSHGPVKPGPPRLTEFDINGTMKVMHINYY